MSDNNFKEFCEGFDEVLKLIFKVVGIIAIVVVASMIIGHQLNQGKEVKDTTFDVVNIKRDSIKLEINHLDSIKDAKIIEVETLDDDSTIKLFYQLIK